MTVAAVIEHEQKFLMVEEHTEQGTRFNQPAGHLEANEDLLTAIQREVKEETAWQFSPDHLLAIQHWKKSDQQPTFIRFCFGGKVSGFDENSLLDPDIIATHWLTLLELESMQDQLRSPLVLLSVKQHLSGQHYPLSLINSLIH